MSQKLAIRAPGLNPTGAYSSGLAVGDLIFIAGQGPWDRDRQEFVLGTIEEQTRLTLLNVEAVLREAGATLDDCVKVTVHLQEIENFARFNKAYQAFFHEPYPVRTTVQSVLDGIGIEIDAIAIRGCGRRNADSKGAGG